MLKSSHLKLDNWVKVSFYPEYNERYEKVFKDACWEISSEGWEVDVDSVRENIDWNNSQYIYIAKDSLWSLETFVDDVGDTYFDRDLDICWDVEESKTESILEHSFWKLDNPFWVYDDEMSRWALLEEKHKSLLF